MQMVDSVDLATNTFKVKPVPAQPAITVTVTTGTQLEDDVGTSDQFTLDNLNDTHFVEVSGYNDGSEGIIATEVEIKELSEVHRTRICNCSFRRCNRRDNDCTWRNI